MRWSHPKNRATTALAATALLATLLVAVSAAAAPTARVLGVHFSSRANSCRVVVDLEANVPYQSGSLSDPDRFYLDLLGTQLGPELNHRIPIGHPVLRQIRLAKNRESVTRLVLDLNHASHQMVTALANPPRLVVDLEPLAPVDLTTQELTNAVASSDTSQESSSRRAGVQDPYSSPGTTDPSQAQPLSQTSSRGPEPFGAAERNPLNYSGESFPRNVVLIDLNAQTAYDDNVQGNNADRIGDTSYVFGPRLGFVGQGKHLGLAVGYQPTFLLYRRTTSLNAFDQTVDWDGHYQFTPHFQVRTRGSLLYQTGAFQPSPSGVLPGLGSPATPNQSIITPLAQQAQRDFRFDATYLVSKRTSFTLFGGFLQRDYNSTSGGSSNLLDTTSQNAGLEYRFRFDANTTFGALYLYQNYGYGPGKRLQSQNALLSFAVQLSPGWTFNIFGGPEYTRTHDGITLPLGSFTVHIPLFRTGWHAALGGGLQKQTDRTVYQITAQRQVTDGGGLYVAAINSYAGTSLRRRLSNRWDATWSAGYSSTTALNSPLLKSQVQGETASFGLQRTLTEKIIARLGYQFNHQHGTGNPAPLPTFDRHYVFVGLSYQISRVPVRR